MSSMFFYKFFYIFLLVFFVPYILIVSSDSSKSLLHRIQDVGSYFFSPYKVLYWKWQETWNSTKQLVFFVHEKLWLSKQKIKLRPILKFKFKMRTCFFLTQQTYFFIFFSFNYKDFCIILSNKQNIFNRETE